MDDGIFEREGLEGAGSEEKSSGPANVRVHPHGLYTETEHDLPDLLQKKSKNFKSSYRQLLRNREIARKVVNYGVGWFLQDPWTMEEAGRLWGGVRADPTPPPPSVEWEKIFQSVHARCQGRLLQAYSKPEDTRWVSYGLSYVALRRCAELGFYTNYGYIYRACAGFHDRFLRRKEPLLYFKDEPCPEQMDFWVDYEDAIGRLPEEDAAICRLRFEGATFGEIGGVLGKNKTSVNRRFNSCLPVIQRAMAAYR